MNTEYIIKLKSRLVKQNYSNAFTEHCCAYARNLLDQRLPVFFDAAHVYRVLRLPEKIPACDYHMFSIITGNKVRTILAPSRELKKRQRWILHHILNLVEVSGAAHGFEKDRSIKTHAMLHAAHGHVICMDIRDFFPSLTKSMVTGVFKNLGYTSGAAQALAQICCFDDILPQGAPTSPKLANIICMQMDTELEKYAASLGITYSRYADDLTFSADTDIRGTVEDVTGIVEKYGLTVNAGKTHCFKPDEPKFITGLVVQNGMVRVPKHYKRELKKEIHFCHKFGVLLHLENTNAAHYANYREYLYGKAYYIHMIEPDAGTEFLNALDRIVWPEYML